MLVMLTAAVAIPVGAQASAASAGRHTELVRILEKGGKWTSSDRDSVRSLIRSGTSIRTRSPRGVTVLMFAARAGDLAMMRAAIEGAVDVNARTVDDLTALWFVMSSRDANRVQLLLDAGANVDAVDSYGRTPLMMATHFKFRGGINRLLSRGANIHSRDHKGHTVLAFTDGHPGITRLLQVAGARE